MDALFTQGKAKRIVAFDKNGKATLYADRLKTIIESRPEIKDLPTIVVTVGGLARSGKSFLLNFLGCYLDYLEETEIKCDWMQSEYKIEGFSWAKSEESITHGIWMFSRPFTVTRDDGSKAAVLLVDSQGTGDNLRSSTKIDTLITYIGLQISSVQVLNVKEYLNANDLLRLDLCTDYADIDDDASQSMKDTHQEDYLFPSLLFLIRDFPGDKDTLGDDPNLFISLISKNETSELKKILEGINKAFLNINSYKMPHPGLNIARASEAENWKVKDVKEDFRKSVRELAHKLFAMDQQSGGSSQCWISATDLLASFKMLKDHLENDDLPPVTNPSDALQEIVMLRAFLKLQQDLGNRIEQICRSEMLKRFATKEELMQFYDNLIKDASENFKIAAKYRKYGDTEILGKYLKMSEDFFTLMCEKVTNRFKYFELKKEQEEIERRKQNQEENHRKALESLTSEIHGYKQRERDREAQFQDDEAKRKAEIDKLRDTMTGVDSENKEERRKLQILIDDLLQAEKDAAKAKKAASEENKHQQAELNARINGIEETRRNDLKRFNDVEVDLQAQLTKAETIYAQNMKRIKGKNFNKGVVRVAAGGMQGAVIGSFFGPVGTGVGAAAGAAANLVVELI